LDFLAELSAQIPNPRERSVIYYGYYSNRSRGERKKLEPLTEAQIVHAREDDEADRRRRRSWARLIRKVYEVDPLICPQCQNEMRIVAFIEDPPVIEKILRHIGQWEEDQDFAPRTHDPPGHGALREPEVVEPFYDDFPLGVPEDDAVLITA